MQIGTGIIKVIRLDGHGYRTARIECPDSLIPGPGKYIQVHNPDEADAPLGWPLFQGGIPGTLEDESTPFLGPIPPSWNPGMPVNLAGPIGHGFHLPPATRRLALAAFGDTAARLLPLIKPAIESGADIAIFTLTHQHPGSLPPAVEIHPLNALAGALSWADFAAIDIPLGALPGLRDTLKLGPHDHIPCRAEALVWTPMPCSALADCGACAVPTLKAKYRLACKDGPVFDVNDLDW